MLAYLCRGQFKNNLHVTVLDQLFIPFKQTQEKQKKKKKKKQEESFVILRLKNFCLINKTFA